MVSSNASYYNDERIARVFEQQEDFESDKPFYLKLLGDTSRKVLEVGSGTGRLSRALSKAGHEVVGVEKAEPMLARAQELLEQEEVPQDSRPSYEQGDVLGQSPPANDFEFVLIPEYTLGGFLDRADQERVLQYCNLALKPGGTLVIHTYLPNPSYFASLKLGHVGNAVREEVATVPLDDTGEQVAITKTNHYSRVSGNVSSEVFYDVIAPDGTVRRTIKHVASHAFTPAELDVLLRGSGLEPVEWYGDFDSSPLSEESHELIVVAARP